ncbi:uncharacterized protein LOC141910031 isoform X2 [Tubulanus polymorphus]|uniref:uncharacterized protein LOC141910031 isoform X2 n=2 Tax=Tubulanus polymorphus TaxID=672921 RepID=UPI003DA45C59
MYIRIRTRARPLNYNGHRSDLKLFADGYTNAEMRIAMLSNFGITISERHLKRQLNRLGLKRNNNYVLNDVTAAVEVELAGSGCCMGYRAMSQRLRQRYGIRAPRSLVSNILQNLDFEGVQNRTHGVLRRRRYFNKGPNYLVHLDGYDKLKPFGFPIHGCIDGFSRRILWLRVGNTNNDPEVVAWYFLDFVQDIEAVPRCIRMDAGTENGRIAAIQKAFRAEYDDETCVLVGRSTSNQRIERWWRSLRNEVVQFWMNVFKDMEENGSLSTADVVHIQTLRYCFFDLINADLQDFVQEWNTHAIRPQRNVDVPPGKPDLLYFSPEYYGTIDYKFPVDAGLLPQIREEFCSKPNESRGCDPDFSAMCDLKTRQGQQSRPTSTPEAAALYDWLLTQF